MRWFKRKQTDQPVLPEIEKYYEAERRERAGLAWLLALVSVACVALLLIGVFFGGKWAYNRFTDDDKAAPVAVQMANDDSNTVLPDGTIKDGGSSTQTNGEPAAPAPPTPTTTPTVGTTAASTTTPAASSTLPNTGPSNLAVTFMLSTVIAWFLHQLFVRRKASR